MLFCFGLFALLLYYTVVANAECSYTYRHSSEQPIEARSLEYQKQGYTRCQFLIELVNKHQELRLNFTRLTGFGLSAAGSSSSSSSSVHHGSLEGEGQEEEEEGWEVGGPGGAEGDAERDGWLEMDGGSRAGGGDPDQSQRSRLITSTTHRPAEAAEGWGPSRGGSAPSLDQGRLSKQGQGNGGSSPGPKTLSGSSSSSAVTTTVWPVSGQGKGEGGGGGGEALAHCLPMVEIWAMDGEGREEMVHRICRQRPATTTTTHTPIVFQYSSSVRIVYEWALGHSSGFTLFFHYSKAQLERCVHTCDDASRCLSETRMLCDGRYDCRDRSDEGTTVCRLTTSPSATRPLDGESLVQVVVISSCAVVVAVLLSAVCLIGCRRWQRGPLHHAAMHHGHGAPHSCLQSHSSESSVARACSTQECNEQAVALLPSSRRSHISWPSSQSHSHPLHPPASRPARDADLELPPNIPVSPDGEEGYAVSQQGLRHPRYHSAHLDLFVRPPPNRTVFDRESPPPYSVTSFPGTCGCRSTSSPSPTGLRQGGRSWPGHERIMGDSVGQSTTVGRCRSMISPPEPQSPPHPSVKGRPHHHHHPPCSSANPGCGGPDPQRLPLLHGACSRKTDTPSSRSPTQPVPCVVTVSFSSLASSSPAICSSSSSSSSPAFSPPASSRPAALLPSSPSGEAPVPSPSESRTTLPSQSVCVVGIGQDKDGCNGSEDSGGDDRPGVPLAAQHGAPPPPSPPPPPSCQGGLGWATGKGEHST